MYHWRTDLLAHKPYWEEWFAGHTDVFLGLRMKRILILGEGGLDGKLLSALESAKFLMASMKDVGHVIHEDKPKEVADTIHWFVDNQRIPTD